MGLAWGKEMYQTLSDAKIVFNRHIDVADDYANNMRLYEATGVGTLLITDHKRNMTSMFTPGLEVLTYRHAEECVELVEYYLEHTEEREAIALAGQERTLKEHTYLHRMQELLDIVRKYI
jgi:spore maturation protein CgeB